MIINRVKDYIKNNQNIDGLLVVKPENRYYVSGFTGSSGYVLVSEDKQIFITDFRYVNQGKDECKGFEIVMHDKDNPVKDIINKYFAGKTLGFEDQYMTVNMHNTLTEGTDFKLKPIGMDIEKLRAIKSKEELDNIRKAQQITDKAFAHIIKWIKKDVTEKEIARELENFVKDNGASGFSFDPIVAFKERAALPHAKPTDKKINGNGFLTMDFGCVYNRYCSDMTRTVYIGEPSEKDIEIYNTVYESNEAVNKHLSPGITNLEIDKISRDIITDKGYGKNYGHGLGHGVGLEVHEEPRLGPAAVEEKIMPNMVVTNEPGIYIEGHGGVRIEDLIITTEDGIEILSSSPKELIKIKL